MYNDIFVIKKRVFIAVPNLAHNIAYAKFGTSFGTALEEDFYTLC